jgi:RHS repeat-associated protein
VGNWANTVLDGQTKTQTITAMNEYDSFAGVAQTHDDNGNLTSDGEKTLVYDFANRLLEVWKPGEAGAQPTLVARYTYDALNRRVSKYFARVKEEAGEYKPDSNTLALYHFNEPTGQILDSSGNNNHGRAPHHIERGVDGLWDTKAVGLYKEPIRVKKSASLDNLADELTIETWVYLKSAECKDYSHKTYWMPHFKHHPKCHWHKHHGHRKGEKHCTCQPKPGWLCLLCSKHWKKGSLLHRPGSYELELGKDRKASFTLFIQRPARPRCQAKHKPGQANCPKCWPRRTDKAKIHSNSQIPLDEWVHLAAVYDSDKIFLYVNSVKQTDEKAITGDVKKVPTPLHLGGEGFTGILEEVRISNTARSRFGGTGSGLETVLRTTFYNGWQTIEERERTAPGQPGEPDQQLGEERVARQFVDAWWIDEHIAIDYYNATGTTIEKTYFYHQNHRGDIVALTDANGGVVLQLRYSAYGEAYRVGQNGQLEAWQDFSLMVYGFQGREVDGETGIYHFRARYYHPEQGRFLQRDPLGYKEGMGLREAFRGNPWRYKDPFGNQVDLAEAAQEIAKIALDPRTPPPVKVGILTAIATTIVALASNPATYAMLAIIIIPGDTPQQQTPTSPSGEAITAAVQAITGVTLTNLEGESVRYYHYTTYPPTSFTKGLWSGSAATVNPYMGQMEASQKLGIPIPTYVYPVTINPRATPVTPPSIVPPSNRYAGGGIQVFFPAGTPPGSVGTPRNVPPARRELCPPKK